MSVFYAVKISESGLRILEFLKYLQLRRFVEVPRDSPLKYQSCKLLKGKLKAVIKNSFIYTRIYLNFLVICMVYL